jgi:hypothetical protein
MLAASKATLQIAASICRRSKHKFTNVSKKKAQDVQCCPAITVAKTCQTIFYPQIAQESEKASCGKAVRRANAKWHLNQS